MKSQAQGQARGIGKELKELSPEREKHRVVSLAFGGENSLLRAAWVVNTRPMPE